MFAEGLAGTGPDAFISQTSVKKYYLPLRAFLARPVVLKPSTLISKWSLLVFRITLKTCTTISLQVGIIHQGQNPRTTAGTLMQMVLWLVLHSQQDTT